MAKDPKKDPKKDPLLDPEDSGAEQGQESGGRQSGTERPEDGHYGNAPSAVSEKDSTSAMNEMARRTKEAMAKEPKVSIMIPLEAGEKPGAVEVVSINHYRLNIRKGCMVKVPQSFAEHIADCYRITMEAGQDRKVERASDVQDALS